MPLIHILLLALVAFLAGAVQLTFGMGAGSLLTPTLALFINPALAVGLMTIITGVAVEVEAIRRYRSVGELRLLLLLVPASLLGLAAGSYLLIGLPAAAMRWIIGGIAVLFGCSEWIRHLRGRPAGRPWPMAWGLPFGIAAGIAGAIANADGLVLSLFLLQRRLDKLRFIGTMNAYLLVMGLLRAALFFKLGVLSPTMLLSTLAVLPAVWLGGFLGVNFNRRVSTQHFRQALATLVLAIGVLLIAR